ncbi:hypothetical protein EG329_012206 [Mollisiaceae sp. DMI_Dod_QoI]|nr:hypothetical protein EG329_012206 [Helotiales sp. DMI_Dod_QoI]
MAPIAPSTTSTAVPVNSEGQTPKHNHVAELGIVTGVIVVVILVIFGVICYRRWKKIRNAERSAHRRRAVDPEQATRAEEYVRRNWRETDRRLQERTDGFELQELRSSGNEHRLKQVIVTPNIENPREPEPIYRHPRMDWRV